MMVKTVAACSDFNFTVLSDLRTKWAKGTKHTGKIYNGRPLWGRYTPPIQCEARNLDFHSRFNVTDHHTIKSMEQYASLQQIVFY